LNRIHRNENAYEQRVDDFDPERHFGSPRGDLSRGCGFSHDLRKIGPGIPRHPSANSPIEKTGPSLILPPARILMLCRSLNWQLRKVYFHAAIISKTGTPFRVD